MENFPDYKVAISFGRPYGDRTVYCYCGHTTTLARGEAKQCSNCQTTNIHDGGYVPVTRRFHDGIYTVIDKDDKSFHVRKQEIIVNVSNREVRPKLSHVWELKYNIRERSASMTKNGQDITCGYHNHTNITQFFKAVKSDKRVLDDFVTERNNDMFNLAYKKFGEINYERTTQVGRALMRFLGCSYLDKIELFAFSGFGRHLNTLYITKDWMHSEETKPHKILGVPKYMLQILRDMHSFNRHDVQRLRSLDEAVGGNNTKILIEISKEESSPEDFVLTIGTLVQLYNDYGYKDIKRLGMYLMREVKLEQGIASPNSAATYLRDYVRMCKDMEIEPREKYPKSLKKLHDIAQMNYRVKADVKKNDDIKAVIETPGYRGLEFKKHPYAVVAPLDANEIIKEGSSLSHCVASYVNDVISERCKILFLRNTEDVGKPLVTIEVRENNIRQVRGAFNRSANVDEMSFVRDWAKDKNLILSTR